MLVMLEHTVPRRRRRRIDEDENKIKHCAEQSEKNGERSFAPAYDAIDIEPNSTREAVLQEAMRSRETLSQQASSTIAPSSPPATKTDLQNASMNRREWFREVLPRLGNRYTQALRSFENQRRDILEVIDDKTK